MSKPTINELIKENAALVAALRAEQIATAAAYGLPATESKK